MKKNSQTIRIRKFRIQDYRTVMKLWQEVRLPVKPKGRDKRQRIKNEILQPNNIFLVAENETGIIGSIIGTHDGRKGWINRLAVHPDFQHQGIAASMVHTVHQQLENLGIHIIACLIEDDNLPSMRFFQKMGFQRHRNIICFSKRKHPYT